MTTLTPQTHNRRQRSAAALFGQCLLALLLGACGALPTPVAPTQPPAEYLARALDWLQANAVKRDSVDWAALRREALARAANPRTTADTYPALLYATAQLGDWLTFFADPAQASSTGSYGLTVLYPQNQIVDIAPGSSAERAGLRLGDVVLTIDGAAPQQWQKAPTVDLYYGRGKTSIQVMVQRAGVDQPVVSLTLDQKTNEHDPGGRRLSAGAHSAGYIELPLTSGASQPYPTKAQQVLRDADQPAACGWIIDLRRNFGGDIWSYLAAIGPVLGQGELGGFVYPDGQQEPWAYRDGKVYWNNNERGESLVEGRIFQPRQALAPVALLTSRATAGAGELVLIAFHGRPDVRTFGEPTAGSPFLQAHTNLSDGAFLSVSGAFGADRAGQTYAGPIAPDEGVGVDWTLFASSQDPVIVAAQAWLASQPACAP